MSSLAELVHLTKCLEEHRVLSCPLKSGHPPLISGPLFWVLTLSNNDRPTGYSTPKYGSCQWLLGCHWLLARTKLNDIDNIDQNFNYYLSRLYAGYVKLVTVGQVHRYEETSCHPFPAGSTPVCSTTLEKEFMCRV